MTPTPPPTGTSTSSRTVSGITLIPTHTVPEVANGKPPHVTAPAAVLATGTSTGSLSIMVVIPGAVPTGASLVPGSLDVTMVGVATLGVPPGDKTLLPLDIINSVLLIAKADPPEYTKITVRIMTFLPTTLPVTPVASLLGEVVLDPLKTV